MSGALFTSFLPHVTGGGWSFNRLESANRSSLAVRQKPLSTDLRV